MRFRVYPYKQGSRSARALADALEGKVLKLEGSRFVPRQDDVIINWGSSTCTRPNVLNSPEAVALAGNKRDAFARLKEADVTIPRFATTREDVSWTGLTVVRHKLTGHSGEGIELVERVEDLPEAPLYVEYVKKEQEYRVHVKGESLICVQRKARNREIENPNWKVRNHQNGFIFVREGFEAPDAVVEAGIRSVAACGLLFGAADIIWNENKQTAFALEVNTAPGLEGRTVEDYANAFRGDLNA